MFQTIWKIYNSFAEIMPSSAIYFVAHCLHEKIFLKKFLYIYLVYSPFKLPHCKLAISDLNTCNLFHHNF